MHEPKNEFRKTKAQNGSIVPIIDDIALHSTLDPQAEAKKQTQYLDDSLASNRNVLILGLGYGYHLFSIEKKLKQSNKAYKIIVIEPSTQLAQDFMKNKPQEFCAEIIVAKNIQNLFDDQAFHNFLCERPVIFKHTNSYLAHQRFFEAILTYRASTRAQDFSHLLSDDSKVFLKNHQSNIEDFFSSIKKQNHIEKKNDFAALALESLLQG